MTFLLLVAMQQSVPAQMRHFLDASSFDAKTTQPGKPVAVRIADPFARLDQERVLWKYLNEAYAHQWDDQTTVADIEREVGKRIALRIDHRALDEFGLQADTVVFPLDGTHAQKNAASRPPSDDPFAAHRRRSPIKGLATQSSAQHWWDKRITKTPVEQLTNAAVLFDGLRNIDHVIATWSGRWLITTHDAAEENLGTRLYDVTPIANIQYGHLSGIGRGRIRLKTSRIVSENPSAHDVLLDVVQTIVDPDTWEMMGGPSTCRVVVVSGRTWLVMSAPIMTHWKVHALLNQLNR